MTVQSLGSLGDQRRSIRQPLAELQAVLEQSASPMRRSPKRRKMAVALEYYLLIKQVRPPGPRRERASREPVGQELLPYYFIDPKILQRHRCQLQAIAAVNPGLRSALVGITRFTSNPVTVRQISWFVYSGRFLDAEKAQVASQANKTFLTALKPAKALLRIVLCLRDPAQ